jgi:hypothetical protein
MIAAALRIGMLRAQECMRLLWLAYAFNVALALPLAAAVADQIAQSIGSSIAGETMLQGFDHLWFRGFHVRASGLPATFEPTVVGIGGVLRALDALVTGALLDLHPSIVAAGVVYLVGWVFLGSGFLARFVGGEPNNFFGGAARHFPRIATLAAFSWLVYAMTLKGLLPLLADIVAAATYDSIDERVHFLCTLAKYAIVWASVWTVSLVFDYAKIIAVARPEQPLRHCVGRALLLVLLHPRAVYGLSAGLLGLGLGFLLLYAVIAPGAGQHNGFKIGIAFVLSQTYVLGRVALRCLGIAAQAELATSLHAGPVPASEA